MIDAYYRKILSFLLILITISISACTTLDVGQGTSVHERNKVTYCQSTMEENKSYDKHKRPARAAASALVPNKLMMNKGGSDDPEKPGAK